MAIWHLPTYKMQYVTLRDHCETEITGLYCLTSSAHCSNDQGISIREKIPLAITNHMSKGGQPPLLTGRTEVSYRYM